MRDSRDDNEGRGLRKRSRCQTDLVSVGGRPLPCAEPAREYVDGLLLCERVALAAKLEGQIGCWEEMLFHIDLWSGEASRRNKKRIVELLDVERTRTTAAIERAYEDLDALGSDTLKAGAPPVRGALAGRGPLRSPLRVLPKDARRLSLALRRLRRR
jgi:hypothetical protein